MKYKTKELEEMSKEELIKVYREAKPSLKKNILENLANSRKFSILMSQLMPEELVDMAKIHPYKEVVVDAMIEEMEFHGAQMARYFDGNYFQKTTFNKFMDELQHKSIFAKIKETFTRRPSLPETLPKKIEQVKKLCEIEVRRNNATGKKMENLELQDLDQAVDKSRVEVNNGEMAKVFDKYAKEALKSGNFFEIPGKETQVAQTVKKQLTEEYLSALGVGYEDVAQLIANAEFENYSGEMFYIPYNRKFWS